MGKDEMKGVPKYRPSFKAYMEQTPEKTPGILYEVSPPLDPARKPVLASLEALAGPIPRTLEIWREPDGKIRICVYVENETVLEIWKSAYPGCKFQKMEKTEPEFVNTLKECPYFFSVEQGHALPFMFLDPKQAGTFIDHLIRLMNVPCWIQIVFQSYHWGDYAEEAAMCWQQAVTEFTEKKLAPKWEVKSGIDVKPSFEYAPASAKLTSTTIVRLGPTIAEQYFQKSHSPAGITLHISGLVAEPTTTLASAFSTVKINLDGLFAIEFRDARALRWMRARATPDPAPFLTLHAKGGFLKDWGKGRELIPTLCLTPQELPIFVHLPTDPDLPIKYTRTGGIPQLISTPAGFEQLKPYLLNRMHKYVVGQTGAGKTTLFLEMVDEWLKTPNPPAIVYIDPKGDDGIKLLKYIPLNEKTVYLNPVTTEFALNPLELPPYDPKSRDRIMGLWISLFMRMIEEWYGSSPATAPRMLRIMRSVLRALYEMSDSPTLADLYTFANRMQKGEGKDVLGQLSTALSSEEQSTLLSEIETITRLEKAAFDPLLNRLADFALDPFLKKMFCSKNTIDVNEFLQPGRVTIFSIPSRDVGADRMKIMMGAIALQVWFAVQYRATMLNESERRQVVLAMDEFQNLRDLKILPQLLAESRSYGLTLVLLHQNFMQLDNATINSIIGNSGIQIAFRVAGEDAGLLGRNWDPRYREPITQEVSVLPLYNVLARVQAVGTQEQAPPARYLVPAPHDWINSDETVNELLARMKEEYAAKKMVQIFRVEKTAWQKYPPVDVILPPNQFKILAAIFLNGDISYSASLKFASLHRDEESRRDWDVLVQNGWLEIYEGLVTKKKTELAKLTAKAQTYFGAITDFRDVGGEEVQKAAKNVWTEYVKAGLFASVVVQTATEERCDLVAFDYENDRAIAVELESESEVKTHPEQVKRNMTKLNPREFDALEMWVPAGLQDVVQKLVDSLPREQARYVALKTY